MEKQFYTKTGQLTDYALACGYMQTFEALDERLCLYKEHNAYHVKMTSNVSRVWEVFDTLTEARQFYKKEYLKLELARLNSRLGFTANCDLLYKKIDKIEKTLKGMN
jgi:hypothetical protein